MSLPRPTICGCLLSLVLGAAFSTYAAAADIVIKRFPDGSGPDAVGVVDASEDTEIEGPQALTTDANGEIYLLDQVNGRIVRFDPKDPSEQPRVMEMPDRLAPTDLIVRKSDILVWDGSIHTLQPDTSGISTSFRGLEEVHTRAADDQTVMSAFAQMGSEKPGDAADLLNPNTRGVSLNRKQAWPRQFVATRGGGSVIVDIIPEGDAAARIEVRHQDDPTGAPIARLSMRVHDRLGAVEFLEIDRQGRMFVFAEDIPTRGGMGGAFVARFSPIGELEGIYELPLIDVPLSRRFVTVSADGDVYFLRTERTGVEVLGIGFQPLSRDEVIKVRFKETGVSLADLPEGPITAVRPLTRQRVIETAFAFEGVQWQVNPGAYGRDPDTVCTGFAGRIRRPTYLHGKLGQQVRGVPYCWGCMGSLSQISYKIEHGVLAGNICTHNSPRSDVAGVDCSSFVSAAWGLSTHFTTAAIPAITKPVTNPWDLRPGDALDKPGSHVMLFLRFTANRMAEVMEASPGACNGRVCRNVYPLASLLARGYRPVRFRGLENDTSTVAEIPDIADSPADKRHHKAVKREASADTQEDHRYESRRYHERRRVEKEHRKFETRRRRERLSRRSVRSDD